MSGLTGFFTRTGISVPFNASAISCTRNGFAVVRAPIHTISTPDLMQSETCFSPATSVTTFIPSSFCTLWSHCRAGAPAPSKVFGCVRGFQTPARNTFTPNALRPSAVCITCDSDSALHGPAISIGALPSGNMFHSPTGMSSSLVPIKFRIIKKGCPVCQAASDFID